ncbi:MAG: hypothetical protein HRU70_00160 [Phycisphaeraceae bacterium]|nr:MAG: hypothetical protein HRU70_00160 [Phycisphaeraceae bacterium]
MDTESQDGSMNEQPPTPSGPASQRPFDWRLFTTYLCSVVVACLCLGAGLAVWFGWKPLEASAKRVVGPTIRGVQFEWPSLGTAPRSPTGLTTVSRSPGQDDQNEPPTWLPESFRERLVERATQAMGSNPDSLSREPLEAIASSMDASGWFDGRPRVELDPEGVARVRGQWRIPAAVVRHNDTDVLVSWEARPMPVEYPKGESGMIAILGVPAGPPQRGSMRDFASPWPGEEVEASLELLRRIRPRPWSSQITAVDASTYAADKRLALVTDTGKRVVWGGRPSKPLWGEISTVRKIERLDQLHRRFGRIDGAISAGSLEIHWDKPLIVDQTSGAPAVEGAKPAAGAP